MTKLKSVDTKNPDEFRAHLLKWNSMARLNGLELTDDEIEQMVQLHSVEGLTAEEAIERMMQS